MSVNRMDRYLLREMSTISLMALAVLLAITLALFLAELLGDVSQGQAASAQVFRLLALRIPEAVLLIGPLALMLGLLMALGQLAQQHELGVFRSSGLAGLRLMRPILMLAVPWALALLVIAAWASPWAHRATVEIGQNLAQELVIGSVRPGQFTPVGSAGLNIYVEHINDETAQLENIFIYFPTSDGAEIISARNGQLQFDEQRQRRVLSLYQGTHVQHESEDGLPMRRIAFAQNDF
ncbi:MAG: LptF/LptG family permease, partial [Pseudomonadota bacterium]